MKSSLLLIYDIPYRKLLADLLQAQLGYTRIIFPDNSTDQLKHGNIDLIILDLAISEASDDLFWIKLRFAYPDSLIIVLLHKPYNKATQLALIAGVKGFFIKEVDSETFIARFKDVIQGVFVIPDDKFFDEIAEFSHSSPADTLSSHSSAIINGLTTRELTILKFLLEGASNKSIASKLHLSEKTVKNNITMIMNKLGVQNRTQAAIWARDHGLGSKSN